MTIEMADLGNWVPAALAAEYDAERDAIRVNVRAVARVRAARGEAAARAFVGYAIAHEQFHRSHPHASEAQAHEHARARTGWSRDAFEAVLR